MSNKVRLVAYQEEHHQDLMRFQLPDEQKRFTALPEEALRKAFPDTQRYPVTIVKGEVPVGFFVLHIGSDYALEIGSPEAILLRAFLIEYQHQGKGYAKEGLKQLPGYVKERFPDAKEIILAVNEMNVAAQKLYQKSGFVDLGHRIMGPQGLQWIMHYTMDN